METQSGNLGCDASVCTSVSMCMNGDLSYSPLWVCLGHMGATGVYFMAKWWQLFWTMESQGGGKKLHTKHKDADTHTEKLYKQ